MDRKITLGGHPAPCTPIAHVRCTPNVKDNIVRQKMQTEFFSIVTVPALDQKFYGEYGLLRKDHIMRATECISDENVRKTIQNTLLDIFESKELSKLLERVYVDSAELNKITVEKNDDENQSKQDKKGSEKKEKSSEKRSEQPISAWDLMCIDPQKVQVELLLAQYKKQLVDFDDYVRAISLDEVTMGEDDMTFARSAVGKEHHDGLVEKILHGQRVWKRQNIEQLRVALIIGRALENLFKIREELRKELKSENKWKTEMNWRHFVKDKFDMSITTANRYRHVALFLSAYPLFLRVPIAYTVLHRHLDNFTKYFQDKANAVEAEVWSDLRYEQGDEAEIRKSLSVDLDDGNEDADADVLWENKPNK